MNRIKKFLLIILFLFTVFLTSCFRDPIELKVPEGFYGGDIYGIYEGNCTISPGGLRIGYTYDYNVMSLDDINIKLYFGIVLDEFKIQLHKILDIQNEDYGKYEFIVRYQTDGFEYEVSTSNILKDFFIDFSDYNSYKDYLCTVELYDDTQKENIYKFNYSNSGVIDVFIEKKEILFSTPRTIYFKIDVLELYEDKFDGAKYRIHEYWASLDYYIKENNFVIYVENNKNMRV